MIKIQQQNLCLLAAEKKEKEALRSCSLVQEKEYRLWLGLLLMSVDFSAHDKLFWKQEGTNQEM